MQCKFTIKEITSSRCFSRTLYVLGAAIVLLAVFHAGMMFGYHKAKFSFSMGENYYRAFEGSERHGKPTFGLGGRSLPDAHGAVGKIIKAELPTLVVLGPDNVEKTILVSNDTLVRRFRDTASTSALTAGEHVVVIGSPNENAEIAASLIRIIPPPRGTSTK
jgi:hypothetical protein